MPDLPTYYGEMPIYWGPDIDDVEGWQINHALLGAMLAEMTHQLAALQSRIGKLEGVSDA